MIFNVGAGGASKASQVKYDNSTSGLGSDNVQGAVDELQESVNELNDSLANITEDSGWLLTGSVAYRKVGNTVYVRRNSSPTIQANTETVIATLPEGYRPPFGITNAEFKTSYFNIMTNGEVIYCTEVANFVHAFYISYLVD